jgi:hypothetical protein
MSAAILCSFHASLVLEILLFLMEGYYLVTNRCSSVTKSYVPLVSGRPSGRGNDAVEKVLISSFMTVLVFFSRAIDAKPGMQLGNPVTDEKTARALDSLACVEFCRRVHMQDYGILVERCVAYLSGHPSASRIFVGFIPPYNNVVHWPGT